MGSIVIAIIILGLLIFVHELGHFTVAKWAGVVVTRFSLGFGPRVLTRTRGETEYALSAIPLGGYVKMLGEDPDEEVAGFDEARSFAAQSLAKRAAIVVAGPAMNLVTAFVAFSIALAIFGVSVPTETPEIGGVMAEMPAAEAGLQAGDTVLAIDDTPISTWQELAETVRGSEGATLRLQVRRADGSETPLVITPQERVERSPFGEEVGKAYLIGIEPGRRNEAVSLPNAIVQGAYQTYFWTKMTLLSIVKIFQGVVSARDLGGPILIVQAAGQQAELGFEYLLRFLGLISVNLGVLNLLPIPVLDGGHLLFFSFEAVRGRPLEIRHREIAQQVGMFLLLALMVFVFYNDITRIVTG
jgi:regulator of sigma E protease